jgi:hypothetical protein
MIYLNKDSINNVVVTLTQKVTLTGLTTYFLFNFISDDTKLNKYFTATDISPNTCRYNQFEITVTGGTENLTGGTIDLELNGYYHYEIFQQDSPTNLDPALASGIVENGKMYLSGTTSPNTISYTGNSENNTYTAYESN